MKKILIILIAFLSIAKIAIAQDWPAPGSYKINNTMGAFHGTWQWIGGTDTVRIYLITQKVFNSMNGGFYWDNIVGWHEYKKGNQTIESSFSYINTPYNNGHSTILGGNENTSNILECQLKDISKNKDYEGTLKLNTAQNQLIWRSTEVGRVYAGSQTVPPAGLTLPRNMVFTKL